MLSPVAVLVVITPMDSQKQYIFGLLSIGILFLMGFSKRRSVSVIMVVTSLLMSTRYMYFRLTQTLHFNSSIEAILGMGLFLAEVYIWVMLLLNYLQTVWPLKRGIVPLPDDMVSGRRSISIFRAITNRWRWCAIPSWRHNALIIQKIK